MNFKELLKKFSVSKHKQTLDADSWYIDVYDATVVERNRYFILMLASFALSILLVILLITLLPLKEKVPYIFEYNKAEHVIAELKPLDRKNFNKDIVLRNYFFQQYIHAWMSFNLESIDYQQQLIRAMSDASVFHQFKNLMNAKNKESPLNNFSDRINRRVTVSQISYPYSDMAEIRFSTINQKRADGTQGERSYWIASVHYQYADQGLNIGDREQFNPIGLFVTQIDFKAVGKQSTQWEHLK